MEITQRTATLEDATLVLSWRNEPSTRKFSRHSELILNDEHSRWYTARLTRVRFEPFYLFEDEHNVVGMSRLDIIPDFTDRYQISILVDSKFQGKGVGTKLLNLTCDSFFRLHPNKSILASVHRENIVSQKLFIGAGFRTLNSSDNFIDFEKVRLEVTPGE